MLIKTDSSHSHLISFVTRSYRAPFARGLRRKLLCLFLMVNMLIWPGADLTVGHLPVLAAAAIEATTDSLSFVPKHFKSFFISQSRRRERHADRLASVSQLQVSPRRLVAYQEDYFTFSALATDSLGRTIQGVRFTWESANPDKVQIDNTGRATFLQPGLASIICRAGLVEASRQVLIRPGRRPVQTDEEWRQDQSSFNPTGAITPAVDQTLIASLLIEQVSEPESQITALGISDHVKRSQVLPRLLASLTEPISERRAAINTAGVRAAAAPLPQAGGYSSNDFAYDELWSEPRNLVGSPRYHVVDQSRLGSVLPEGSNFHLAIPIVSIPGRGLNGGITLHYNSRVWGRRASTVTFDPIASWPSPGFSLGFGRIVTYDTEYNPPHLNRTKYMLIDADGTRHYLGQSAPGDWLGGVSGETSDGYHITFSGYWNSFSIKYNDGTLVSYSRINNRLLPNWIQDTNGNYVTITYKDGSDQYDGQGNWFTYPPNAIDYITDTLGRQIQFNYTAQPGVRKLVSITKPGFGGTSQNPVTDTVVEFQYEDKSATNSFSGLTVQNLPGTFSALRRVVFPATGTGYLFSHSAYGMIYNYSLRRNASTISDGTESASLSFNYPTVASSLTDAPSFSQRTESATSSPTAVYSYSSSIDSVAQTQTFTITRPDSTQLLLTRSTNTSSPANGLLIQTEIKSGSTTYAKSVLSYANDPGGSPQVQSVTSYDDANTPTKTDFDYDQYGNVTNRREYGHQISGVWQVRRRTRTTYKIDSAYINANLRSLPILVEVLDAKQDTNDSNDELIAKTSLTYDDYQAMGGMENYGGTASPPGHTGAGTSHTVRGNVTGTTKWTDVIADTSLARLKKYDIFGNVVEEEVSCCNERSYTLTETNYWSQAEEAIDGSGTSTPLMNTAEYDFNTGATENQTDPSDLTTSYSYDAAMRPSSATAPSGASASLNYNDGSLSFGASVSYDDGGTNKSVGTSSELNGWGRVIESVNEQGGKINTTYDAMGRVVSRTNPYPSGGQPGPSTSYEYDALGRTIEVTLPDGDEITYTYDGNRVTVTDQVNRKIKRESDGLGRLVKVTEQDATGALAQETTYSYDLLNNLIEVNQGGQLRKYKYDALGRMLYEKLPEQTATISDGAGGMWTTKYVYNNFNAVTSKTDARGVITSYSYDSLHRLTQKSYNTSGATGVAATPTVYYFYDSEGLPWLIRIGELGNPDLYEESYNYDSFNRLQSVAHTFKAQTTSARTYTSSYDYNEAGQLKQLTYPSNREIDLSYNNQGKLLSLVDNGLGVNYLTQASYNHAGQLTGWNLNGVTESYTYGNNRMQLTRQTAINSGVTLMDLNYSYQAAAGQMGAGSTAGNAGQLMGITNSTIGGATESAAYTYDLQGRLVTSNQTTNGASAQRRFAYDRWGSRTGVWDQTTGGNQIQSVAIEQSAGAPTNRVEAVINASIPTSYHHPDEVGTNTTIPINRSGRYVRVQLSAVDVLSLAEVEVMSPTGTNLSQGQTADQSSTWSTAAASRAVDGNTNGKYLAGSVSVTQMEENPYWEVDLGSVQEVGTIKLWNRTDCCSENLTDFYVFVSNTPFSTTDLGTMLSQSQPAVVYSYDDAGNVIDDGVHTYQYDAENRVVGMDIGTSNAYIYAYDYQNRRLTSLSSATGTWTNYVWEGYQVLAEYNQAGTLLTEYIYAGSRIIAKRASGTVRYFLSDRLSIRASLDASGNVVGRQGHLPFGEEIGTSGEFDMKRFTSYERDDESGLDYAVNRSYSPAVGRFLQVDPYSASANIGVPQSWNRYGYTQNNPINRTDRLGLDEDDDEDLGPCWRDENGQLRCPTGESVTVRPGDDDWDDVFGDTVGDISLGPALIDPGFFSGPLRAPSDDPLIIRTEEELKEDRDNCINSADKHWEERKKELDKKFEADLEKELKVDYDKIWSALWGAIVGAMVNGAPLSLAALPAIVTGALLGISLDLTYKGFKLSLKLLGKMMTLNAQTVQSKKNCWYLYNMYGGEERSPYK